MRWFFQPFKKYAAFRGRAGRPEFWVFTVISFGFYFVLAGLDLFFGRLSKDYYVGPLSGIFVAFFSLPWIAVSVRRLHDTAHSGWWYLIQVIPLIGLPWFFVLAARKGNPGENRYGSPPTTFVAQ
jgi:uncharacterized membrane protein YhaH (DUF805 family)